MAGIPLDGAEVFLVWLAGMAAWLLMGWLSTGGSVFLTGLAMLFPLVLWRFVGSYWWSVILPLGAVGLLYWLLFLGGMEQ